MLLRLIAAAALSFVAVPVAAEICVFDLGADGHALEKRCVDYSGMLAADVISADTADALTLDPGDPCSARNHRGLALLEDPHGGSYLCDGSRKVGELSASAADTMRRLLADAPLVRRFDNVVHDSTSDVWSFVDTDTGRSYWCENPRNFGIYVTAPTDPSTTAPQAPR